MVDGLTRENLAKIETGKRKSLDVGLLLDLAHALGVPPTALLFDITEPMAHVDGPTWVDDWIASQSPGDSEKPRLFMLLRWYALESAVPEDLIPTPAGLQVIRQGLAAQAAQFYSASLRQFLNRNGGIDQLFANDDPKLLDYAGRTVQQAWMSYRRALDVGLKGLPEPAVPEGVALEMLRMAERPRDGQEFGRILDRWEGNDG